MKQRIKSVIWKARYKKHPSTAVKRKREFLRNEDNLNILHNMKHNNICIMGVPEEESEQGIDNLFEDIIAGNFPNLVKEKNTQVQKTERVPNKLDPNRPKRRDIIIKLAKFKDKERILKAAREKQVVIYKREPIRI